MSAERHERSDVLRVGERFEFYETPNPADEGVWEVVRVSACSAVARKAGLIHKHIEARNEWVRNPLTGTRYKRPLAEPKVIDKDVPDSRTITISRAAMVRRVEACQ